MWVLSCTFRFLSGCFTAPELADGDVSDVLEVSALRIADRGGGHWPVDAIPRVPIIEVYVNAAVPRASQVAWLVRGDSDDELLADLLDPPLRSASEARLVPARVESEGSMLTIVPESALPPRTQLTLVVRTATDQAYTQRLLVSASPSAGAALIASHPPDKAHAVPPNLQAILLRFDGTLGFDRSVIELRREETQVGAAVERLPCSQLGLGVGDCVRVSPSTVLGSEVTYVLHARALFDATGASLANLQIAFTTSAEPDVALPQLGPVACALDELRVDDLGCLLTSDQGVTLRLAPNEPVRAQLRTANASASALSAQDSCVLTLRGLSAETAYAGSLLLTDLAGNTLSRVVQFDTRAPLAMLTIDEVRSDPLGPEPAQEFVELLNSGTRPVSLMGFSISTDVREPGRSITSALQVAPGERVLAVAPAFEVDEPSDGALPAGVRVARLDAALSLANTGQSLVLRDANGARLDVVAGLPAPEGRCVARTAGAAQLPERAPFAVAACTPGEASVQP